MCNDAWYINTGTDAFVMKMARETREEPEQNDLYTEAALLQQLHLRNPALPVPRVLFAASQPMVYAYHHIPGEWMKTAWPAMTEQERQELCAAIGQLHATLHGLLNEAECSALGLHIDRDATLEAENEDDLARVLADQELPAALRDLAVLCFHTLQASQPAAIYAFCHNDSHHENILVHEGKLNGLVDFGDADHGDVHRDFGRYALDYPHYFETILRRYEAATGRRLSRKRILSRAFLEALEEIAYEYAGHKRQEAIHQFERLWKQYADETT